MVFPIIAIAVVSIITATIGGVAVYLDGRRRSVRYRLWASATAIGFLFGILPGAIILAIYLGLTRI